MESFAKETIPANLEKEMRQSYLDYAMSVIVGRALPDVRDGLKPVHRRVIYAMGEQGIDWNKAYKKSARIVGDVMGKYHPHGDTAIYDTIVRMAQSFSLRYPLIDGQGNFGSVDGDAPAAMRYTEIRLARIAHEILADIDKETVNFSPNYDETETQPVVLPTRIPNLLINGSSGIAVGMATNIPPHNLTEVVTACLAVIENDEISTAELMEIIPGPDFPTAGIINGVAGIRRAYATGRGKIYVRARAGIETNDKSGRQAIIIHELPYQVNKARLQEKIAELVKNKRVEGISALRDESDKSGMRVVIEIKRGDIAEVVLNQLYAYTQMQTVFGINIVALANNQPRLFTLKELLEEFIRHRREVVIRRTIFDLKKARARAHILEGLAVALASIDEVIELIRASANPAEAREKLLSRSWQPGVVKDLLAKSGADMSRPENLAPEFGLQDEGYRLSETQAQAILDLRLHRLTGLEQDKLKADYADIVDQIAELLHILNSGARLLEIIREELEDIRDRYGDERKTEIREAEEDLTAEDLIAEEDMVVTISHTGYAKCQPVSDYRAQKRGGKGKLATRTKDEDFVARMFVANSHDTVLCFADSGKVYWLRVFQLPQAGRVARGRPLVNLLPLDPNEKITALLPVHEYGEDQFLVMVTASGTIKKSPLTAFARQRNAGLIAVNLAAGDHLVGVGITDGNSDIILFSKNGKASRFNETKLRATGRTARGVRGIRLKQQDDVVISMITIPPDSPADETVLLGTENGYGKRTLVSEFSTHGRGGQGVKSIQTNGRNGSVVSAMRVNEDEEVMLISDSGILIRTRVKEISTLGRSTQGVRLINMGEGEKLVSVCRVEESEEESEDELTNEADMIKSDPAVAENSTEVSILDTASQVSDENETDDKLSDDSDDSDDSNDPDDTMH